MFRMVHTNFNVTDLNTSIRFYEKALHLHEVRRHEAPDGRYTLVFLSDGISGHEVELTHLRDRTEPYDLTDNEIHLAFHTDDFEKAHALHKEMGCVCQESLARGLYFIEDPDGYWLEIVDGKR